MSGRVACVADKCSNTARDVGQLCPMHGGPVVSEGAAEVLEMWSCGHCGPHKRSDSGWCGSGCGRDHGGMTKVLVTSAASPPPSQGVPESDDDSVLRAIADGAHAWDDAMNEEQAPGEVPYLNVWIRDALTAAGYSIVPTASLARPSQGVLSESEREGVEERRQRIARFIEWSESIHVSPEVGSQLRQAARDLRASVDLIDRLASPLPPEEGGQE